MNKATRQCREVPCHRLQRLIQAAARTATTEDEFLDRLLASGLLVRPRNSATNPNRLVGTPLRHPTTRTPQGSAPFCARATLVHATLDAARILHEGPATEEPNSTTTLASDALRRLDGAISCLHKRLAQHRSLTRLCMIRAWVCLSVGFGVG
jgi:hypothetical protein